MGGSEEEDRDGVDGHWLPGIPLVVQHWTGDSSACETGHRAACSAPVGLGWGSVVVTDLGGVGKRNAASPPVAHCSHIRRNGVQGLCVA